MNFFKRKVEEDGHEETETFSVRGMLRQSVHSIRAMIDSRLELIVCEFREEKARLVSLLIFGAGAVFLGFLGLMSITAAVTFYFYENAFAVLLGFSAFYLAAALGFILVLRSRMKAPLFPETVEQLKKDREELFD